MAIIKRRFNETMDGQITYEAIKNGDIKAFEALFREFYPSMCFVAMRFIGNEEAAEDIVQEAFIKLWEKRTTYNDIPCLKTFLYVSVKNLCFNHIRNKKNTIDYTSPEVQNKEVIFKNHLIEEFNGSCTEMEGAAIAQGAYLNKIPYVVLRAISDKADDSATMDYPTFESEAARHCVNLLQEMVKRL